MQGDNDYKRVHLRKFEVRLVSPEHGILFKKAVFKFAKLETAIQDCLEITVDKEKLKKVEAGCLCFGAHEVRVEQDGKIKLWLGLRNACKEPEMEVIEPDMTGIPKKLVID